jgi:hypothetical protein
MTQPRTEPTPNPINSPLEQFAAIFFKMKLTFVFHAAVELRFSPPSRSETIGNLIAHRLSDCLSLPYTMSALASLQ